MDECECGHGLDLHDPHDLACKDPMCGCREYVDWLENHMVENYGMSREEAASEIAAVDAALKGASCISDTRVSLIDDGVELERLIDTPVSGPEWEECCYTEKQVLLGCLLAGLTAFAIGFAVAVLVGG